MLGRSARHRPEGREITRLHLIAVCCEIVVLAALIEEDILRIAGDQGLEETRRNCREHRDAAERVISGERCADHLSHEELLGALDVFRRRLLDMRHLRGCLEGMRHARVAQRAGWGPGAWGRGTQGSGAVDVAKTRPPRQGAVQAIRRRRPPSSWF